MAKPIFSVKLSDEGPEYFLILNTISGLPHTIPMDIISFLNYNRNNFNEFLPVFHQVYPQLRNTGSTLEGFSYNLLSPQIRIQVERIAKNIKSSTNPAQINKANEITKLFVKFKSFKSLKKALDIVFNDLSPHLPRPFEYYESWHLTFSALFKNEFLENNYLDELLNAETDDSGDVIVPEFLFSLINQNLIPLNSIPHVFRKNTIIEDVFRQYGAELLLPQVSVVDLPVQETFAWQEVEMIGTYLKRFTELCLHSDLGISDSIKENLKSSKKPIHQMSDEELFQLNDFSFKNQKLFNFSNQTGLYKLQWKYVSIIQADDLTFLADFHGNSINLFNSILGHQIGESFFNDIIRISGDIFEANISDYYHDNSIFRYDKDLDKIEYLRKSLVNHQCIEFYATDACLVGEINRYYYCSGWTSFDNKPLSPLCFTSAGKSSEGLTPVCLNGKWGYVDDSYNLVIPPIFGHAQSFNAGYAKVFILEKEFYNESGDWVDLSINEDISEQSIFKNTIRTFNKKFQGYNKKCRLPIRVLLNKSFNRNIIDLHYFGSSNGEELQSNIGRYVIINKKGEIIENSKYKVNSDLAPKEQIDIQENNDLHYKSSKKNNNLRIDKDADLEILEEENYFKKISNKEINIYKLPDKLLSNIKFMLSLFKNNFIDYSILPLNYKLNVDFISNLLEKNPESIDLLPISVKEKYKKQLIINKENKIMLDFIDEMNKIIQVNREWPENISFFELYAGKSDDMSFHILEANKAISVEKFLKLTSEALIELRNKNELSSNVQFTLDNLVNTLVNSVIFKVPEYISLNILLNPEGLRINKNGNSDEIFMVFTCDELFQPDFYSSIFLKGTSTSNFIIECENYVTENPRIADEEDVKNFHQRIILFLKSIGFSEQPLLSVPIIKQSIDSIFSLYPTPETNIPVQLNPDNEINLEDTEDELPF